MSIKRILITIFSICVSILSVWSQQCIFSLKGFIQDESSHTPLEFATILIVESQKGAAADEKGYFEINNLCAGRYHLQISHIGCEAQKIYIDLQRDTVIKILLHHHTELLNEITVHSNHEQSTAQVVQSISSEEINKNANKNLADLLGEISGVAIIKNGSGISKPIIHGMYGNRITILNNGLIQAGQQWGNDHAPEIDPFMSDHINVVKGAASLAYGGNGLGSIVMIENGTIDEDPHLHGKVNYIYQTNGRGHTLNSNLQHWSPSLSWRISGTYKKSGDHQAPDYFLTNTGKNETNLGIQVYKKFLPKWTTLLYASTFNTEIGILRGSHIGNIMDLQESFARDTPFFTSSSFTYAIDAPRQFVNHHLIKLENKWQQNDHLIYNIKYGYQINNRKEFDVRRGDRSSIPSLSLYQQAHYLEGSLHKEYSESLHLKSGVQLNITDNLNETGTGILPLIPNYVSAKPGAFIILEKIKDKYRLEGGIRSDINVLQVATITRTTPQTIQKNSHDFINFNSAFGIKINFNKVIQMSYNTGLAMRAPEVNELYSNGLHQGVSGIEEGNKTLVSEKSIKNIVGADFNFRQKLFFQVIAYHHYIGDYIYLKPSDELRLTIRGAFPVYKYLQINARIHGLDLTSTWHIIDHIKWQGQYSYIKGRDVSANQGLVFIPPNSLRSQVDFLFAEGKRLKNTSFNIQYKRAFRQVNISKEQDFILPPDAYSLVNMELNTSIAIKKNILKFSLIVDNVLNTRYRDYLNRLRYFADETGRNIQIRMGLDF